MLTVVVKPHEATVRVARQAQLELGELRRAAEGSGEAYAGYAFRSSDVSKLTDAMATLSATLQNQAGRLASSSGGNGGATTADAERSTILGRLLAEWIRGQLHEALASAAAQEGSADSYFRRTAAPIAAGHMLDQLFPALNEAKTPSAIMDSPAVVGAVREVVDALKFNPLLRASRGLDPQAQPTVLGTFVAQRPTESPWTAVINEAGQYRATPSLEEPPRW